MDFSAVTALAVGVIALASPARPDGIYKYVEKDGTIVYTNVPPNGKVRAQKLRGTFKAAPSAREPAEPQPASALSYDEHVEKAAVRYRIPSSLLRAVIHAESNFDPRAVSPKGAAGLMQLMPITAEEMYVKDIFDVHDNIEGGARYLRFLANMFDGDMVKIVAAYNAGPDAVKKFGGLVPPYDETQAYVHKVIQLYFQYKQQSQLAKVDSR